MTTGDAPQRSRPSPWLLLVFCLAVTVGSYFLAESDTEALVLIGVFGALTWVFAWILIRRRRPSELAAIPIGVELRSAGLRPLRLALLAGTAGLPLLLFPGAPLLLRAGGAILITIALMALLMLTGHAPKRFLRIDAQGLTFGESGYDYLVPWNAMGYISQFTYARQPVVAFDVRDLAAIRVTSGISRLRMRWAFLRNRWIVEHDVMILTSQFGLRAGALRDALDAHVEQHSAR